MAMQQAAYRLVAAWALALLPALSMAEAAAAPAGLTVSQAVVSGRDLTLYLDARDATGVPIADLPARRVIVTLTDGDDDAPGMRGPDEVRAAIAEGAPVPLYAIGFSTLTDRARREAGLAALGGFARASGGVFVDASADPNPATAFAALRARLRNVWRVQLRCDDCVLDGNLHRLTLRRAGVGLPMVLPVGLDLRLLPEVGQPAKPAQPEPESLPLPGQSPPDGPDPVDAGRPTDGAAVTTATDTTDQAPPAPLSPGPWRWLGVGVAALLLLLLALLVLRRRRRGALASNAMAQARGSAQAATAPAAVPEAPRAADLAPTRVAPVLRPPPTRQLRLAFIAGARRGEVLTLGLAPVATIGRAPDCALVLTDDAEVSARHAELALLAGARADSPVVLRDLGSTNGTRLNGIAIAGTHPLASGDVIGIGQTEFRVTL